MRYLVILAMICALLWAISSNADCAGVRVVGKGQCECNPLVARGIIPDPLNMLKEAVTFPQVGPVLDQLAVDIREVVGQIGTGNGATASVAPSEEAKEQKEKPSLEEKPGKEEKPAKEQTLAPSKAKKPVKHLKKSERKPKKKVKVPPKAT
jgi:hypothetical protein